MRENQQGNPFSQIDYNRQFNISSLTATEASQSPPKQPIFSPRNIKNFFARNLQQISSPRVFMESIHQSLRGQNKKAKSSFSIEEISKEFEKYLKSTQKQIEIYKGNRKKKHIQIQETNEKQQIENEVKLSKIPVEYFEEWTQDPQEEISKVQQKNIQHSEKHLSSKKLELLMVPSITETYRKKQRINMRQKQEELSEYLDQVEVIIFTKAKKYPEKYMNYLNNISSTDFQIEEALNSVKQFRGVINKKLLYIAMKYKKIFQLTVRRKNLQQTTKIIQYMQAMKILKQKEKNIEEVPKQINQEEVSRLLEQKQSPIYQIVSIKKIVENIQETHIKIKNNRLKAIKKELSDLLTALLTTYNRQDWLRSQLPKQIIKPELQEKLGIIQHTSDGLNSSVLNISVLDQSYCMGAIKSGSFTDIKVNSIKNIKGFEQRKQKLKADWRGYCEDYYGKSFIFLQEEQEILGQLILKQLLKHNGSFNRDIEDYLTLVYAQKNLIQQAQTHPERLYFLQAKFYNKIIALYYDALKSLINFINSCFPELIQTFEKVLQFLKERIEDFIKFRKIDQSTELGEVVTLMAGTFDYWITNSNFLADLPLNLQSNQSPQQQWQQFIFQRKVKIIEEYINKVHQFTLVNKIKLEIEEDNLQIVSIPSKYFLTFDYILNWGQIGQEIENHESNTNLDLEVSLSFLGEIDNPLSKPKFSIFKIIDKMLIIEGKRFRVVKSFFVLIQQIESYLRVKVHFPELTKKIDEKVCELIGFYSWYCKKMAIGKDNSKKILKNIFVFKQLCLLLKKILDILSITTVPKKTEKLQKDFEALLTEANKQINMFSYGLVEIQFGKLYESRLKVRKEVPTSESMRIIQILEKTRLTAEEFEGSSKQSLMSTVKVICKNYFGYLLNMQSRGKAELRWFLPKFRECVGDLFNEQIINLQKKLGSQNY